VVLSSGDTEEHTRRLHGLAVVRDNNELRLFLKLGKDAGEPGRIGLVEGGIDFVEHNERTGIHAQNGRQKRHACHRTFAAGKRGDGGEALAGWRGLDANAIAAVFGLVELERSRAGAEELGEIMGELLGQGGEVGPEALTDHAVEFSDYAAEVGFGGFEVGDLRRELRVPGFYVLVFGGLLVARGGVGFE
jgi:hypothetical protein